MKNDSNIVKKKNMGLTKNFDRLLGEFEGRTKKLDEYFALVPNSGIVYLIQ